ncbi:hypothetical protein [Embleya sp. NPDC005575]|uniref:hypothetical protein n=1 Tax=Embleya sp. NPDC005575 TaxID=3156892 RepID=UPI0033A57AF5
MTGPDAADRLRAELTAEVEHLPPTVAPYARIVRDGTRARRRRATLIGVPVAAVIVALALTVASLSGSSTRASGPAAAAPVATPTVGAPTDRASTTATSTEAAPKSPPIASGELAGHRWELVHAPPPRPTETFRADAVRQPPCDVVEALLDGHLANRGGTWCASSPGDSSASSGASSRMTSIGIGDTALYKPGVGSLGTITYGVVPPEVVKVVATFHNGASPITVTPTNNGPNGASFYVIPFANGAGFGESGSLQFYDAQGKLLDAMTRVRLGSGK